MKDINYFVAKSSDDNCIYDQADPRVAQRVRSKRQGGCNSITSQRRRQTNRNLVRARKMMRTGHRQGDGVGGCSSGVVCEIEIVGRSFLSAGGHAHFRMYFWESL